MATGTGGDRPGPLRGLDHCGGLAVIGDRTLVAGRGRLQVHDTGALRRGVSEPLATAGVRASSTVTVHRGDLYVSRFRVDGPGMTWRYAFVDGRPIEAGARFVAPCGRRA